MAQAKYPSIEFCDDRCIAVHVPSFESASINTFFGNLAKHYVGKSPSEIAHHASEYEVAVKKWPAPKDAKVGWAVTLHLIILQLDQYASLAKAAKQPLAGAA